jgi:N-acetyl-anhydromuramyl-L-alanine amidase AmpD
MRTIRKIIIHCSATPPGMDIGVKEIRGWHVTSNGWDDVGYHYVIRRDGVVETGRPLDRAGAHTAGHNTDSVGVCLVGGVEADRKTPEANYTAAQWSTLETLVRKLLIRFPSASVHGHREFARKACPSFDVREWAEGVL